MLLAVKRLRAESTAGSGPAANSRKKAVCEKRGGVAEIIIRRREYDESTISLALRAESSAVQSGVWNLI
jgi:hypothetical protein